MVGRNTSQSVCFDSATPSAAKRCVVTPSSANVLESPVAAPAALQVGPPASFRELGSPLLRLLLVPSRVLRVARGSRLQHFAKLFLQPPNASLCFSRACSCSSSNFFTSAMSATSGPPMGRSSRGHVSGDINLIPHPFCNRCPVDRDIARSAPHAAQGTWEPEDQALEPGCWNRGPDSCNSSQPVALLVPVRASFRANSSHRGPRPAPSVPPSPVAPAASCAPPPARARSFWAAPGAGPPLPSLCSGR